MTYNDFDYINSSYVFSDPFLTSSNLNENFINDLCLNEEDNRRYFIHNTNISQDTNLKQTMNINYNNENRTRDITVRKPKDLVNDNAPPFCSLNETRGILIKNVENNSKLIDKIIKDEKVLESEEYLISIKKKSTNNSKYQNDFAFNQENFIDFMNEGVNERNNCLKKKRGRKTNKKGGDVHSCNDSDNIIKKIKAKIFFYCLLFINAMINKEDTEERIKLLKIDYKYTDQLEKKMNLGLFEMTLKDLFSLDVSRKYKKKTKDYNKNLINRILEKKIEVEDFDTVNFIFKITLYDWIDLFTKKKNILTLINEKNAEKVNYIKIQDKFDKFGVNHLLNEILKKNDDGKHYTLFLLYLFNFQRWFYIKRGRILKEKAE